MTDEEMMYASPEEWDFYNRCIEGLPKREGKRGNFWDKNGYEIPWGSGPHILKYFKEVNEIVKPHNILEIGLCLGAGASMWLNLCNANLMSIDISDREETIEAGEVLKKRFPQRYNYLITGDATAALEDVKFDLCWLDGAHDEASITKDIQMCKKLNIPYILFDDWQPRFGETQLAVAKFPELELVKDLHNLRLYKWK